MLQFSLSFHRVQPAAGPVPSRRSLSLVEGQWLPEHLLPLLLLGIREEGLDFALVFLADLHHLGPNLLGITARLGLFDERFDLLLQVLDDRHELLALFVRDLQGVPNLWPSVQQ